MHQATPLHRSLVLAAALSTACVPPQASEEERSDVTDNGAACIATLDSQHYLTTAGGHHLFVEPRFVEARDADVVVMGTPTYAWSIEDAGAGNPLRASVATTEPFVGASFTPTEARTIAPPRETGAVRWIHGAVLPDGPSGFVLESPESTEPDAPTRALVFARFGAEGWEEVDSIPVPGEGELLSGIATHPLYDDGELLWAALLVQGVRAFVALYRRDDGGWRGPEVVDAHPDDIAAAVAPSGDPVLVVAGLDPSEDLQRAGLRTHQPITGPAHVVWIAGPDERFRTLTAGATDEGLQAAWLARGGRRRGAWVVALPSTGRSEPRLLDAQAGTLSRLGSRGRWAFWATSGADTTTGSPRLRLHRSSADSVEQIADLPSPFVGLLSGTLSPTGEIVVVGPEAHFETTTPFVRSLVLRFSLSCDS